MYSFKNDYSEGAHPRIMQALLDTNLDQTDGYGTDPHCERARALIREKIAPALLEELQTTHTALEAFEY